MLKVVFNHLYNKTCIQVRSDRTEKVFLDKISDMQNAMKTSFLSKSLKAKIPFEFQFRKSLS